MKIKNDFNLKKEALELGVSVWKTPSFLFLIMGAINVIVMAVVYFCSKRYDSPEILILSESIITIVIFSIGNIIIKSVEEITKLNKIKSEFIAVASHQLRTPLSAIRWETELLNSKLKRGLTKKQMRSVENINTLVVRMNKLVNNLLDVAKIDQNKLFLKKERLDLIEITREVIADMAAVIEADGLIVKIKTPIKEAFVLGDSEKIKLVVENLISNSIKYSKKQGKIDINIKKVNSFWVFSIKDNGIGIPKSQQNQVFSKFFRSYNVSLYQAEGSGLGLYIVKNIVENSGGRIWFKSEENIGSIFNFSLPKT